MITFYSATQAVPSSDLGYVTRWFATREDAEAFRAEESAHPVKVDEHAVEPTLAGMVAWLNATELSG